MISSVVGFDIGYSSCYVGIARGGGIEVIDNEYSARSNPTVVAYGNTADGRKMGTSAQSQRSQNIKNTLVGFKPLVGRVFDDPMIVPNLREMFNDIKQCEDGSIGFDVEYEGGNVVLSPEHVTSSLFVYLKQVAQNKLGFAVNDCVISVPLYFCDYQRRAMIFAAQTAGLNVLKLMNETTAVSLAYGIYKQDLPAEQEKPRLIVFVDIGDNDTQVSAVAFNKGKLEVRKSVADPNLGGRHFVQRIFDYFKAEFLKKYKLDVTQRGKAVLRLKSECAKIMKTMSANSTPIPLNIECLMNDVDVSGRIDRDKFEEITLDLFDRLKHLLQELLHNASFSVDDIDAVEIVGGATRIPRAKATINEILRKTCSTTLNADEVVARGCALQCAILSPAFKVRDFAIHDLLQYGIKLVWYDPNGNIGGDMEVFSAGHQFPFSKMLTFYRKDNLILEASYSTPVPPHPQNVIGKYEIGPLKPAEDGSSVKVKVKVKIDAHGTLVVDSAHTVTKITVEVEEPKTPTKEKSATKEEKEKTKDEKMETEGTENKQNGASTESNENVKVDENSEKIDNKDKTEEEKMSEEAQVNGDKIITEEDNSKKKKTKTKTIQNPLTINSDLPGFGYKFLQDSIERENNMINNDKMIKDRHMSKNAVEEYVYDMRDKLYGKFEKYIAEPDKAAYIAFLTKVEDWLYDEGENCQKQVYIDKLAELKHTGDKIVRRYTEHEGRQPALNMLGSSLVHVRKIIEMYLNKDEKYDHLLEEEVATLTTKEAEVMDFFNDACNKSQTQPIDQDPVVTVASINNKRKELEDKCNPIINKPKPKVEPPPIPAEPPKEAEKPAADSENTDAPMEEAPAAPPAADENATHMDLD